MVKTPAIEITVYPKKRIQAEISPQDIERITEISGVYFPKGEMLSSIVRRHIDEADVIVLARRQNKIIGFSIASLSTIQTPFYKHAVPAIYQRMLFVAPDILKKRIGITLGVKTYRSLLGWLWFAKRFVLYCRTMNPNVVKRIQLFSEYYPRYREQIPAEVMSFAQSLAPRLETASINEQLKLIDVFSEYGNIDATNTWNLYLHSHCRECEEIVLDGCFTREEGRLIYTGNAQLLIGFNRPFGMLKLAFR
jgi:hypothetical protein